jgi:hypothetical protein
MRLLVEIAGELIPITEVDGVDFVDCKPSDMRGVPTVYCMMTDGTLKLWPKPIAACAIWRLESQPHAS